MSTTTTLAAEFAAQWLLENPGRQIESFYLSPIEIILAGGPGCPPKVRVTIEVLDGRPVPIDALEMAGAVG